MIVRPLRWRPYIHSGRPLLYFQRELVHAYWCICGKVHSYQYSCYGKWSTKFHYTVDWLARSKFFASSFPVKYTMRKTIQFYGEIPLEVHPWQHLEILRHKIKASVWVRLQICRWWFARSSFVNMDWLQSQHGYVIIRWGNRGMKLLNHSETSTVQSSKFANFK